MKAFLVARKSLCEIRREQQLLLLVLALPIVFLVITAATYGGDLQMTHPIQVVSADPEGDTLVEAIAAERHPDGEPVFDVEQTVDRAKAQDTLEDGATTAVVVIAPNAAGSYEITVVGDASNSAFYRAATILDGVINRVVDVQTGRLPGFTIREKPVHAAQPETQFDLYAPGMMIFALLMIIPQTAMLVAREVRWHTMQRLRLSAVRAWELLSGVGLAQLVVAVGQVLVVLGIALALGFHNNGSLLLAILVGLVIAASAIGQGLLVASLVQNDSQAANLGSSVAMIQVFLSGAFYPMPPQTVFTLLGHQIDLFDMFPATHGFLALQQVLTFGASLEQVAFRLSAMVALSILYLAFGILLFSYVQMKRRVS